MQKVVTGTITSSNISAMGKMRYGYLGIETVDDEHIKVKVTAFTKFDTLEVGAKIQAELESVGDEAVLTANKIAALP
jgi:hypothetical protein